MRGVILTAFLASVSAAGAYAQDDQNLARLNDGVAVCRKVSLPDDCIKTPWRDFVAKHGDKLTHDDIDRFRRAQLAHVQLGLGQIRDRANAIDDEDKQVADRFCADLFQRLRIRRAIEDCRGYVADMIWDLRTNAGKRVALRLEEDRERERRQLEAIKAGLGKAAASTAETPTACSDEAWGEALNMLMIPPYFYGTDFPPELELGDDDWSLSARPADGVCGPQAKRAGR